MKMLWMLLSLLAGCHAGQDQPASQFLAFRELPANYEKSAPPHSLVLRTDIKGVVEFVESDDYLIEVNVTAENTDQLSRLQYNYTTHNGAILLQLYQDDKAGAVDSGLKYVFLTQGSVTVLGFFLTLVVVCWWNIVKRPHLQDTKITCSDASQAPLLEGPASSAQGQAQGGSQQRNKKPKKIPATKQLTSEDYLSSEDDQLSKGSPHRGGFAPSPAKRVTTEEGPILQSGESTLRRDVTDGKPSRPVVQFVNMQGQPANTDTYRRRVAEGHYPASDSMGDLDNQTTLKIRDGGRHHDMPDVVKRGQSGDYSTDTTQKPPPERYISIQGDQMIPNPPADPDYNMSKLSGAHIAQILSDAKSSPKFSHNTDRRPVTFSAPKDEMERVELDSVGSSRSGESSKSSGIRTQGSYDSDKRSTPVTDSSDSARSSTTSTSAGARSKDMLYGPRFFLQGGRQNGHASPASSTDQSDSGSSPRLVDEAYGTMGSSSGSTLRNGSNASTGSGSNSSVVTVIAAEDPNATYARRRMYHKPPPLEGDIGGSLKHDVPRRSGGRGTGPQYLHTSIVCTLAIICLTTGVYCHLVTETTAKIKVHVPPGFLRTPIIYSSKDRHVDVVNTASTLQVHHYKVPRASMVYLTEDKCVGHACEQGCDSNTDKCLCREGYHLKMGSRCEDVNECNRNPCGSNSLCINTDGAYECRCLMGFHGDETGCHSCDVPCKEGTFEYMRCKDQQAKVCQECKKTCMEGYYIHKDCTPLNNTDCRACHPKCNLGEYEFTPCNGHQNRQCHNIRELGKPRMSINLKYEDRRKVQHAETYPLTQEPTSGSLTHLFQLARGTDFVVNVHMSDSNLAPIFQAVDHSDSHDNSGFYGDMTVMVDYCPYPVPEKYRLSMVLHTGKTTKANYYSCDPNNRKACDMETGYYLNPWESCRTYSTFGNVPPLNSQGWNVLCTRPGRLSDVFGTSSSLIELSSNLVDKTNQCAERRTQCDHCTTQCAEKMQHYHGSHRCNITAEDSDNGESPRLPYCFACCAKEDCTQKCEVYTDPNCEQLRCVTGNLAEFVLTPVFSEKGSIFGCHIEPVPGYKIYDLELRLTYQGRKVNDRVVRIQKVYMDHHPENAVDKHQFLRVKYGSMVWSKPNLVEGDIQNVPNFGVGLYQAEGPTLEDSQVASRTVIVRPKTPFSVSSKTWSKENCNTEKLSELVMASRPTSGDNHPYKPDVGLNVEYESKGLYRIFNRTANSNPFIQLEIREEDSILKSFFPETTVRDDDTLKAELKWQSRKWVLKVKGQLVNFPGYFYLKVYDPGSPHNPMYEYDIAVTDSPPAFNITFHVDTGSAGDHDKNLIVEIRDTFRTIKLDVFRPAPNMTESKPVTHVHYENKGETPMTIFTPFIAVMCVIISFLALLLLVGFLTEPGRRVPKNDNKVHSQHLLFVVCFVTFRTGYSIVITFTFLLLLINYLNKHSLSTLSEFHRYADSAVNSQKVEIDKIQQFVTRELDRQNALANGTKYKCEKKLHELQDILEESKQQMKVENVEERLVSQVALEYTSVMVNNLTRDIQKFKREFSAYARKAVDRLTRSIVQTSNALESNQWLQGAKRIHEAVQSKRGRGNTKPFLEWAGLQQEVKQLNADISLSGFPMPNISEFLELEKPKTNYSKQTSIPKITDIILPMNQWNYQYENKPVVGGNQNRKEPSRSKVKGRDIISWKSLLATLVVIDLIWFIHRMARSYSTAKMILYGCPAYIDCRRADGRKLENKPSVTSRCLNFLKDLNIRVMKTEFVPKLVATATVCCAIYLVLAVSDKLLTVKTLASVGYFESMVAPVETSYRLARTRIKTNAYRINNFEYPFYEELVNVRTKRYQLMLDMYADLQRSSNLLHDSEYCAWQKLLHPGAPCNCTMAQSRKLRFDGCQLPPVTPLPYNRKDFGEYRDHLSNSIVSYVNASRQVVMDTCHMVLIFVAILVMVDALGAVTWIYLKRFNLLRLKPMFEIEQYPSSQVNHT